MGGFREAQSFAVKEIILIYQTFTILPLLNLVNSTYNFNFPFQCSSRKYLEYRMCS